MPQKLNNFIHFLAAEKENTIKVCVNLGKDFFFFHNLDILFQKMLEIGIEPSKNILIPSYLFLNVHREYYLGIDHFLSLHNTKSFLNLRSAIDSTFTAYYLLKNPEKLDVYLQTIKGHKVDEELKKEWKSTFLNIKRTMKDNETSFPLSKKLVEIHEFCSVYAHADALSLVTRYAESPGDTLELNYFDYEQTPEDYKKWMGTLLFGFFEVLIVFWKEFFESRAKNKSQEIITRLKTYNNVLTEFRGKYKFKTNL